MWKADVEVADAGRAAGEAAEELGAVPPPELCRSTPGRRCTFNAHVGGVRLHVAAFESQARTIVTVHGVR